MTARTESTSGIAPIESRGAIDRRRTGRRDRLVGAATDLSREHGWNGIGVAAICAEANATKGVFSHHFPEGKDELLLEVLQRNANEIDRLAEDLLDSCPTVADAVRGLFDGYADLIERNPNYGCPIAAAVVDTSATHDAARETAGASFERWEQKLEHAHRTEAGSGSDPDLAVTAIAALEGAILLARARRDADVLRRTGATMGKLFSVGATPGATRFRNHLVPIDESR